MFERFTDRARRVVVLAQEEARMLNHNFIGTEHLLLGLISDGEGVASRALAELDVSLTSVRSQVEEIVGRGGSAPTGHVPFTPRAKKVLELSLRESRHLGHDYIGTEHILLGLVREGEGVAAQVLEKQGLTLALVRDQVLNILSELEQGHDTAGPAGGSAPGGFIGHSDVTFRRWRGGLPSRRRRRPREGRVGGALCPGCGSDVAASAAYRVYPVADASGEGVRDVLFVYCGECGATLAGEVLPSGEGDAGGGRETGA
jgi:ATP-dependent Clp protease ATP-binding subunit ClpC